MIEVDQLLRLNGIDKEAFNYCIDASQRGILFLDVLRKRGNNYIDHLDDDQPPVLIFKYDILLDARTFKKPANYALSKIIDRRAGNKSTSIDIEKRDNVNNEYIPENPNKRPIVIIDPRAGHGPGIGGSKQESEIGMALSKGYAVYFIFFFTNPIPGQTLADVKNTEIIFLEEIKKRHPNAPPPAIIGNCQGGWAATFLSASRPDIAGPLVLNGSPLSYWAGVDGKNPMRYKGGLLGGVWINSFLSDLSNGKFDGANLVMNMENLNPGNTNWIKYYNLYADVENEEKRFLEFEKWWGGFFWMTKAEIHKIVEGLFIGNHLVRGKFTLDDGEVINLKNFAHPVVVFASEGDNITPPQQALNWIGQVYCSDDEIKRCQQVIVYIVHPKIGHLGIFVSSSIAKKEQKEIIGSVEMINYLAPGLYEMVIDQDPSKPWMNDYKVKFEERTLTDISNLSNGRGGEDGFSHVEILSELNDKFYNAFISPLVQKISTRNLSMALRFFHPLRIQRYFYADVNPNMSSVNTLAFYIKKNRIIADETNCFKVIEGHIAKTIEESWNLYRDIRDLGQEVVFKSIYTNPWLKFFLPLNSNSANKANDKKNNLEQKKKLAIDKQDRLAAIEDGGFIEGLIRVLVAVITLDNVIEETEMKEAKRIINGLPQLKDMRSEEFRFLVAAQSRIIQIDKEKALQALPKLLKTEEERIAVIKFAYDIAKANGRDECNMEIALIEKINHILSNQPNKLIRP